MARPRTGVLPGATAFPTSADNASIHVRSAANQNGTDSASGGRSTGGGRTSGGADRWSTAANCKGSQGDGMVYNVSDSRPGATSGAPKAAAGRSLSRALTEKYSRYMWQGRGNDGVAAGAVGHLTDAVCRAHTPPSRRASTTQPVHTSFEGGLKSASSSTVHGIAGAGSVVPRIVQLTMRSVARAGASTASPVRAGSQHLSDAARTSTLGSPANSGPLGPALDPSVRGGGRCSMAAAAAAAAAGVSLFGASSHDDNITAAAAAAAMVTAADESCHGGRASALAMWEGRGAGPCQPFGSTVFAGLSTDPAGASIGAVNGGAFGISSALGLSATAHAFPAPYGAGELLLGPGSSCGVHMYESGPDPSGDWLQYSGTAGAAAAAAVAAYGGSVHDHARSSTLGSLPPPQALMPSASAGIPAGMEISVASRAVSEVVSVAGGAGLRGTEGGSWYEAVVSAVPHPASGDVLILVVLLPPITGDTFLHLATSHSALTVLFCDIQGFTSMCGVVKPATVMAFLNDLYTRLDAMLDAFGVYKVETIGDCYVAAGGLIKVDEETGAVTVRSDDVDPQHAHRTVQFAKVGELGGLGLNEAILRAASSVRLPTSGEPVRLRVGIHSGPAMSGVVGTRMPRFCLFGDTINTASRMESTGQPGAVHVSQSTRDLTPREDWVPTGGVEAKGKGRMETYLLRLGNDEGV
ncbi:hypothetical protein GPECTOR_2g1239 [Gonium pectorale]|uniref:Guanylate cyclase domain-containing protein n=1 Tax=Gonium pectorale TaxID=33097 RepID=A0A150H0N8_GONPE|nr:hypothetical protein GPECTOR_2g1239 [Gonium pectorale]|eukprot:KXZ55689.1 hypothetical protein GPECTOR_2g1239 [Gonium pectorale]